MCLTQCSAFHFTVQKTLSLLFCSLLVAYVLCLCQCLHVDVAQPVLSSLSCLALSVSDPVFASAFHFTILFSARGLCFFLVEYFPVSICSPPFSLSFLFSLVSLVSLRIRSLSLCASLCAQGSLGFLTQFELVDYRSTLSRVMDHSMPLDICPRMRLW